MRLREKLKRISPFVMSIVAAFESFSKSLDCLLHVFVLMSSSAGFSLLFYGFGSKRKVIEQFVVDCCKDGIVIVLNGFDGSAESKQVC